jgi:hypothetical protein
VGDFVEPCAVKRLSNGPPDIPHYILGVEGFDGSGEPVSSRSSWSEAPRYIHIVADAVGTWRRRRAGVLPVGLLRTVDRISFASNDRAGEQEEQEEEQEEEEGQTDGDPL